MRSFTSWNQAQYPRILSRQLALQSSRQEDCQVPCRCLRGLANFVHIPESLVLPELGSRGYCLWSLSLLGLRSKLGRGGPPNHPWHNSLVLGGTFTWKGALASFPLRLLLGSKSPTWRMGTPSFCAAGGILLVVTEVQVNLFAYWPGAEVFLNLALLSASSWLSYAGLCGVVYTQQCSSVSVLRLQIILLQLRVG